ncbi:unnamed protein product [Effrenium voratum]|nr:unnamed protein product [Effrenium voratum]
MLPMQGVLEMQPLPAGRAGLNFLYVCQKHGEDILDRWPCVRRDLELGLSKEEYRLLDQPAAAWGAAAEAAPGDVVEVAEAFESGDAAATLLPAGLRGIVKFRSTKMIQQTVLGDMYVRQMEHTKGHTQTLTHGQWHPFRSELFLTSSLDGTMRMWDMTADPVGMDQVLPCVHVLKTVDKRNVCVGGGSGKQGGLFPTVCCYSPTDAKKIVAGCSDGSVQLFFDKARFMRPDRTRAAGGEPGRTMKLWFLRSEKLDDANFPNGTVGNLEGILSDQDLSNNAQRAHLAPSCGRSSGGSGRALDLGCGRGRHSLVLLDLGYEVTAVDRDAAALEQLKLRAEAGGACERLRLAQIDVESSPANLGLFDVVLVATRKAIMELVALGGLLIFEAWAEGNEDFAQALERLLRPNELLQAVLPSFTVLAYAHGLQEDYEGRDCVKQMICARRIGEGVTSQHPTHLLKRLLATTPDASFLKESPASAKSGCTRRALRRCSTSAWRRAFAFASGLRPQGRQGGVPCPHGLRRASPGALGRVPGAAANGRDGRNGETMEEGKIQGFLQAAKLVTSQDVVERGQGWTMVVAQLQACDALQTFHQGLFAATGLSGGINAYLTPPGAIGKPPHVDDHDVLVLQLSGSKRWTLEDGKAAQVTLQTGDVLYLPQGLPHHAAAQEDPLPSLHLAVGLHRQPMAACSVLGALVTLRGRDGPVCGDVLPASLVEEMETRSASFGAFASGRRHWLQQLLSMHLPLVCALEPQNLEAGVLDQLAQELRGRCRELAGLIRDPGGSFGDAPGAARQRALLRAAAAGSETELEDIAQLPMQEFRELAGAAFWARREFVMDQHFTHNGSPTVPSAPAELEISGSRPGKSWQPGKSWSPDNSALSRSGQVNSGILQRSAEEILQLLEGDEVRSFDFVNLVTALHRVAKLGGALYAKVSSGLSDASNKRPRHTANTAWALARLQALGVPLLGALGTAFLGAKGMVEDWAGSDAEPQSLATMARACATVAHREVKLWDALGSLTLEQAPQFDTRGTSNALRASGAARIFGPRLAEASAASAAPRMAQFDEQALSTTLRAAAKLQLQRHQLTGAATEEVLQRQNFQQQGLANLSRAFATLRVGESRALDVLAGCALRSAAELRPQHLSNVAWSFAKVHLLNEQLTAETCRQAQHQMPQFGAQNVGNLVRAFAKLLLEDAPLIAAASEAAVRKIRSCGHQEIGNIAWAFATFGARGVALLGATAAEAQCTVEKLNAQGAANSARGSAKLSHQSLPFSETMASAALAGMDNWDPQAIANVAWANATASHMSEPLMTATSLRAVCIITEFTTQNLSNSVWAYATLRAECEAVSDDLDLQEMLDTKSRYDSGQVCLVVDGSKKVASKKYDVATVILSVKDRFHDLEDMRAELSAYLETCVGGEGPRETQRLRPRPVAALLRGGVLRVNGRRWPFGAKRDSRDACSARLESYWTLAPSLAPRKRERTKAQQSRREGQNGILRTSHSAAVTDIGFVPEGVESNLLITRSLDNTMKIWDCRMLNDAKGPVKVFDDLRTAHEKTGICTSPDGRYIVTGTSLAKGALGAATVRVYDAKTLSLVKSLDFGKKSVLRVAWPKDLNQILVGTTSGEVVMLYSPFSSRKGALHFEPWQRPSQRTAPWRKQAPARSST